MASAAGTAARPSEPPWLAARRERAAQRSRQLELPQHKGVAGWEFTELRGLELDAFAVSQDGDSSALDRAAPLFDGVEGGLALRQVDGAALPSDGAGVDGSGPLVMPLAEAVRRVPELVEPHLGRIVARRMTSEVSAERHPQTSELLEADPFLVRNDAAWAGGLFVHVPRGQRLDLPVLATAVHDAAGSALHWRTLIVLEEGAQAEVWEQYLSADPEREGLFNGVTELVVGPNAHLRYVCGQELNERSWVFGSQRAEVARDGSLDWVALGFGGRGGKVRMETQLAGPGASAKVTGAYAARARQHIDFDTTQEHAERDTTSDLAFRGLLAGRATAVWRGMIKVDPGAQRTDAFQESRSLLLSKRAHADAIPGLEILANDVRCTHAAAIAQIDPNQLFYLRCHGLPDAQATRLVIEGFLAALVERFEPGPVREALAGAIERRLEEVLGT